MKLLHNNPLRVEQQLRQVFDSSALPSLWMGDVSFESLIEPLPVARSSAERRRLRLRRRRHAVREGG